MSIKKLFLVFFAIAFLCSVNLVVPQHSYSQATITLKYANFPPAPTFPCVQMERWKTEVEKRTNGKVKVQTFPGGTLLPAKNIFDGVISGMADIGNFAMSYQPGRFPISEAVDLPVGFANARVASLVLFDLIEKYNAKEFEKVKLLTLFTCPPANLMTSKPVKALKDLKGMEIRVSGTSVDVLKNLGGSPIAMPQSDTPEALQKGVVKGNFSSMEVLKDFNYAAYTPYVTLVNLQVVSFAVVMNKDKWNALPADVKKIFDDMRREQAEWTGTYVDDHVKEALIWSKQKYKDFQVFELPKSDSAEIPKLMQPIIDGYVKKTNALGLPGDQIVKDINSLKAKYEKVYK
ncbi:MAG: TRAP transporter substrate-binding protein [Proteobacteria bacterium]|nr:TRAP transporter substrate-binding protein [Pseudomonadota bacterium]